MPVHMFYGPLTSSPTFTQANGTSTDILEIANSPVLWVCVVAVFAIVLAQSAIYLKAVRRAGPGIGLSPMDQRTALRAGAISAIGPSLAVCLVAIALLALFGTPAVLVRIGLIGSAAYDASSASIAAGTVGAKLGDHTYTQNVFGIAFFAMSIGGCMWMVTTLALTPLLRRGDVKLRSLNPAVMTIIPAAALIGAFAALAFTEIPKSSVHAAALISSGVTMGVCLALARFAGQKWLREWGLGISILVALIVAYAVHTGQA